ncbi:hypothetical protein 1013_scaffold3125_00061 [Bacteriophage sp.]|nr:hypothetical protein 1013_scaffold3125_00061 [Bacteriophage sp.]
MIIFDSSSKSSKKTFVTFKPSTSIFLFLAFSATTPAS